MRYNIIKTRLDLKTIEYEGRGLTANEATTLLQEIHERELSKMFQDTTKIQSFGDCQYFHVIKNGVTFQYQIEEDMFWKIGQAINPKSSIFNDVEVSNIYKNFQLN